jgi:hypothetical protein
VCRPYARASHRRIQACLKRASEALYYGRDPVAADAQALLEVETEVGFEVWGVRGLCLGFTVYGLRFTVEG